ncbi:Callose synthase [Cynara cardunculus var. scolymus]|uniref:Callose synthase n=1 Tax=Cynara cardunculus var. scolymus TaxID=59895 RepID=A0A124SBY2_CYNCS|nr:Callose synthase [Cynara cardunculus var. scolymus]
MNISGTVLKELVTENMVLNLRISQIKKNSSPDCFALGWPMRDDGDFFKSTRDMAQVLLYSINISDFNLLKDFFFKYINGKQPSQKAGSLGKLYFVETRSFWNTFRSFDRLWTFFILALQIMIIIAWSDVSISGVFEKQMLYNLSSIFITAAFLRLFQSMFCFLELLWILVHYMLIITSIPFEIASLRKKC